MPTERKTKSVEMLSELIGESTIAISTDYTGMTVVAMTDLRRVLREKKVRYKVVKNNLVYLAADAAGKPLVKDIVAGVTGIAFGFEDPVVPAKALADFVRDTRAPLKIRGGVLGDRALAPDEVSRLAALPSKDALVGRLLGQLQGPVAGLVYVLSAPLSGFARALQAIVDAGEKDGSSGADPAPSLE